MSFYVSWIQVIVMGNDKELKEKIDEAYQTLQSFFKSKESFLTQLDSIESTEEREKFLTLIIHYKYLVKESHLTTNGRNDDRFIGYINDTFQYLSLLSLIESLYTEEKYQDFYQWLRSNKKKSILPIENNTQLEMVHESYLDFHGSTRKVVHFFQDIPDNYRWILEKDVERYKIEKGNGLPGKAVKEKPDIERIARSLYQIRSDFVHDARLVTEISGIPSITRRGNRYILSKLTIESFSLIFEVVILNKFGFEV